MRKDSKGKYLVLNGTLFKILTKNRSQDRMVLWNFEKKERQVFSYRAVQANRKPVYTYTELGHMLGRAPTMIRNMAHTGDLPMPHRIYSMEKGTPQGLRWDEDQAIAVWRHFSQTHRGRPRADGEIKNNIPSESEFRAMMNQEVVYYVQTENGFVPTWKAQDL